MPSSEAQEYFLAIEREFLALRGAPMMLSPADWQVARGWAELGVPLRVVLGVLERVFAQRRERGAKGRVQGLRYFDDAVRAAWDEILELQGPVSTGSTANAPSGLDVEGRLQRLAEALPADLAARERWVTRVLAARDAGAGGVQSVEQALRAADRELLGCVRSWLDPAELQREEAEVERTLEALRERLSPDALARTAERLLERRLRDRWDLPELTLFGPPPAR